MKRLLQRPASRFLPSCPGFLPRVWVPSPGRQGKVPDLKDLLLRHAHDILIPAVSINQMKIYAPCSTSTTLLTGSGHDLQLISRVVPCSLKHLDTSCSLQHIDRYMPSSTRSNKETQLLFSPDPASLERSIHKKARSTSTDNNTCASLDFAQPPSTQTLVPSTQTLVPYTDTRSPLSTDTRSPLSTDTRSPLSTEDTHLPSTDIIHPTSIDTPSQTSIDTEPRDMVVTLILVRENNGDMHDHEGHLQAAIDRQPPAPIDRRAPITYRVQILKIDVARLNALRPKPEASENPPETVRTPSDDGENPMEEDRVPTGRTLRRRKEKVAKHLKRGANEKEKENFRKRVFRIPLHKSFEEAYYTHKLWIFFRETRDKKEDIKRIFSEAREKMSMRITLKKESDPGQFAIPCTMKGIEFPHALCDTRASVSILPRRKSGGIVRDLDVQIGNALPVDFHVLDIKLNWNSSLLLGRAFWSTVGAVCNFQTNQLCLTLIDPNTHYDPIPVKKPQTISRRINDPGIIATCHCGAKYESDYSASIDTHPVKSIDNTHRKSTDTHKEELVDTYPDEWENDYNNPTTAAYTKKNMHIDEYDEDYEEERATEYIAILDEEEKLLHHSSWKRNAPSIDMKRSPSIDTQPHQRNRKRTSTDTAYYKSIDTEVNHAREGHYLIGSWANEHHHESFAVETTIYAPGADKLHDGFTDEELLNMQ
ncbi:hypothetical protein F2Q69_00007480 [Brassica cretica]|uniref:Aspartic peptidase DDI1-type domain-containing protein n=1 Tax=Brassica cretica TaxID=69181 RepID=A0A8S9P3C8_BRACR|nr:hypothetical protein F2Q69_00007480 [Brassica cretica]